MKTFKEFMEQMTPPKAPGNRPLLNLTPTEKQKDSLIRLSNRSGIRNKVMTGKKVYPWSEGQIGKDRILGARIKSTDSQIKKQYDKINNPQDPGTAEKLLRGV